MSINKTQRQIKIVKTAFKVICEIKTTKQKKKKTQNFPLFFLPKNACQSYRRTRELENFTEIPGRKTAFFLSSPTRWWEQHTATCFFGLQPLTVELVKSLARVHTRAHTHTQHYCSVAVHLPLLKGARKITKMALSSGRHESCVELIRDSQQAGHGLADTLSQPGLLEAAAPSIARADLRVWCAQCMSVPLRVVVLFCSEFWVLLYCMALNI